MKRDVRMWKENTCVHCWWEVWIGAVTIKNSMEDLQNIKNIISTWSSNPTPRYIFGRNEISISKKVLHAHFHCSIIHNCQDVEITQVSVSGWIKKMQCIYSQWILLSHKKMEILSSAAIWMNLEGIMLYKISQTEKRQILDVITYMWKQNKINFGDFSWWSSG